MSLDRYKVVNIALTQYELHTIITALKFRSDLWELEIAGGNNEVADNKRDLDLMEKLEIFKSNS